MKHLVSTLAAVCSATLFATAAVADQQQMRSDACRADVERLCKDVPPGKGNIGKCLKDNEASVSAGCKEHIAKMRGQMQERVQAFDQACKGDAEQYCKGVQRGQGRMVGCLRDNQAKLSASCKGQLSQMDARRKQRQARMHGATEACKGDAAQYCKDVQPGGGRVANCLKANSAQLSAACKAAFKPK